jgi:hypothetical protein
MIVGTIIIVGIVICGIYEQYCDHKENMKVMELQILQEQNEKGTK